jgi:urea carboxylase
MLKGGMMFYEEPVYRTLGDLCVSVEFGDEHDLRLSFQVIALKVALELNPIKGVLELIPVNACLGLIYNPMEISRERLIASVKEIQKSLGEISEIPSRLFKIPIWYNDPWSAECARAHEMPNNVEFMAEVNKMSVEQVIKVHSGTDWWVSGVGFTPGCFQSQPLDPTLVLTAPKYHRPRKWTSDRILCYAGRITSFYPIASPGGYQLLGRSPINTYDPQQRYPIFKGSPVIAQVSDRHRYVPIDEPTYWEISRAYEAAAYEYEVIEEPYRIKGYLDALAMSQVTRAACKSDGGEC